MRLNKVGLILGLLMVAFCPQWVNASTVPAGSSNAPLNAQRHYQSHRVSQHSRSTHRSASKTHSKQASRKRHIRPKHRPNTQTPTLEQITGQQPMVQNAQKTPSVAQLAATNAVLPVPKITEPSGSKSVPVTLNNVVTGPPANNVTNYSAQQSNFAPKRVVNAVYSTLHNLSYSVYQLGGTYFNALQGVYKLDCSSYVNHLLSTAVPTAYRSMTAETDSPRPTSRDYFSFFDSLTPGITQDDWYRVAAVDSLDPGDILVFRYKHLGGRDASGHVMVVVGKPQPVSASDSTFLVRVADSAPSGHTADTRPPHTSGIGVGTLLLKVNPETGLPYAYAWKEGARWEYNMDFAMARPMSA